MSIGCLICRCVLECCNKRMDTDILLFLACCSFWTMWNHIRIEHRVEKYQTKRIDNLILLQGVVSTYDMHT